MRNLDDETLTGNVLARYNAETMNKQEACEFLGVSERSMARYAAQGKVQVTYTKGTRGNVAVYNDADLRKLKEELAEPVSIRPSVINENHATSASLAKRSMASIPDLFNHLHARDEALISALTSLSHHRATVAIESKLTLDLVEASMLSGLSKQRLREAIKDKKLKGKIIGRGWRIKRADLEIYIQKL